MFSNSPSEEPRPVKSNRRTPIPLLASPCAIRFAARMSLVQVKQCANKTKASGRPDAGMSRAADNRNPFALEK